MFSSLLIFNLVCLSPIIHLRIEKLHSQLACEGVIPNNLRARFHKWCGFVLIEPHQSSGVSKFNSYGKSNGGSFWSYWQNCVISSLHSYSECPKFCQRVEAVIAASLNPLSLTPRPLKI